MEAFNESYVRSLLSKSIDEYAGEKLEKTGAIKGVGIHGSNVAIDLKLGYPADGFAADLASTVTGTLEADSGVDKAVVNVSWKVVSHKVQGELKPHPGIRNIIAVASGKGGVGKSTTAVNLALALAKDGASVGILDADIYGPSIPRMMGVSGQPETNGNRIIPHQAHGVKVMSMGFLVGEDTPMIWRGPMVTSALKQLLSESDWGELDYLVIDLPPGTGDIQLTLVQSIPVSGAVIVTTPQDIALLDARKALQMFRKLDLPVLGVVENMSTHICSACGHEEAIFGSGGGQAMASEYEIPLLGQLPLDLSIRSAVDRGEPTVVSEPEGAISAAYVDFSRKSAARLSLQPRNLKLDLPEIKIQTR